MKKKEYLAELRTKTKTELQTELEERRKELADLRLQHSTRKLKDVKSLSKMRRKIAQVLTAMEEIRE